ncbi:hypothetical protein NXW50_30970 [Bacteroides thetaiotaomicron]|nr:hypothetical protein [Bacteroides thetaiotaomicron]MCS2282388.1 hypothetical protein [Bacteroides thetaiotaomicron]
MNRQPKDPISGKPTPTTWSCLISFPPKHVMPSNRNLHTTDDSAAGPAFDRSGAIQQMSGFETNIPLSSAIKGSTDRAGFHLGEQAAKNNCRMIGFQLLRRRTDNF